MRLFVTGGAGFIGSNFIHHILGADERYSVVNYDKLTYAGNLANLEAVAGDSRYRFVKGDICDANSVAVAMKGCEAVVHFAAESHVDRSIYEPAPAIETNVTGTFILLQVARELGIAKFVHVSTDEVYGDLPPGTRAGESHPLRPSSPYSASKAAADMLVGSYVRTYGLNAVITRGSNTYGPYQFPEKVLPLMISNAIDGKPLPVYGDGLQERDWIHVSDHCAGVLAALQRGRAGEIYNLGGGNVDTNLAMAKRVLRILNKTESLICHVEDRPGHDRRYALDSSKSARNLGWTPAINLEEGLKRTVAWYQQNSAWLAGVRSRDYLEYYSRYYENRERSLKDLRATASPSD